MQFFYNNHISRNCSVTRNCPAPRQEFFGLDYFEVLSLNTFKACVLYFLSNFYFSPNDSSLKTMKNVFLFHLKSSFRSRDIQVFVFSSSPLFLPVSHCFRGLSKKNLKVYDVINCLNKNLITHFV